MRIISKYSDYYDSVMGSGYDPSLIFKRKGAFDDPIDSYVNFDDSFGYRATVDHTDQARYLGTKLNPEYFGYVYLGNRSKKLHNNRIILEKAFRAHSKRNVTIIDSVFYVIGFCGKTYVIYEIDYSIDNNRSCFRIVNKKNKLFQKVDKKKRDMIVVGEIPDLIRGNVHDIFLYLNCPIFLLEMVKYNNRVKIIRNPILKDLGFAAILDPYTAYQELSMYMGSVFAPSEPDMVDISDKDLSESKGFNDWSFKKYPTKRKSK